MACGPEIGASQAKDHTEIVDEDGFNVDMGLIGVPSSSRIDVTPRSEIPAGHEVATEWCQVIVDVEGAAVHGHPASRLDADRRNLSVVRPDPCIPRITPACLC